MGWDEYGIARYIALVIMKLASVEKIARRSPAGRLARWIISEVVNSGGGKLGVGQSGEMDRA